MRHEFDATLKDLVEEFLPDYLVTIRDLLGLGLSGAVRVIDADVSTVSASADKVCLVEGPRGRWWISSHKPDRTPSCRNGC